MMANPQLRQLLGHPRMAGARAECREGLLEVRLRRINLVEVFDDFAKVCPGDFVLTTGYAWEQYCGDGGEAVAALQQRGAACLAFQEDIYQPCLPVSLQQAAAVRDFPLLVLPRHFTFRLVSQAWAEAGAGEMGEQGRVDEDQVAPGRAEAALSPEELLGRWQREAAAWVAAQGWLEALPALPEGEGLRTTLAAYLAAGGNHAQAAARLGVHRHTVRNRLRQLAAASGLDLEDQATRLILELALGSNQEQ